MGRYTDEQYFDKDCIFCKIVKGEMQADKIAESEFCIAFRDINPKAPVHVLVVPKPHVRDIMELDDFLMSESLTMVQEVARVLGIDKKGFNVVNNCGSEAGQMVFHAHFHVLSGKKFDL